MITNYHRFINEAKGLGLDALTPQEIGQLLIRECDKKRPSLHKIKELIDAGASLDVQDHHGDTPILLASKHGHIEITRLLIQSGASLDIHDNDGWTVLHYAAHYGHLEVLRMLIDAGADLEVVNSGNYTPLHYAAWCGGIEVTEELLKAGALASKSIESDFGFTPWGLADDKIKEALPELKP